MNHSSDDNVTETQFVYRKKSGLGCILTFSTITNTAA